LGHVHLIVEGVDTKEGDSLFDQFGDFHELVSGTLTVKLLGDDKVIEDVVLVFDVELLVLVSIAFLKFEELFFLQVQKLVQVHVFLA
jgi:hypothetical protein